MKPKGKAMNRNKNDTHGSDEEEWVGFDLDGTLAKYDGWKGIEHIGEPVERMVLIAKLLHWLGKKIKIMTARVAPRTGKDDSEKAREYVQKWCEKNLGFVPDITYVKDASMVALFDDRAVAVQPNTGKVLGGWPDALPKASDKAKNAILKTEKKADARSPDFDHVVKEFKDRYGIDLSHVKMRWSKHPRYNNGKISHEFKDDETGGSHGHVGDESVVWINPNMRPVMNRFGVSGKVKDFRRWLMAHELAHEIDSTMKKNDFVGKVLREAKEKNYTSAYLKTVPERKFDKELFAEYMAHLLSKPADAEKKASISIHERLLRTIMRRNPGFSRRDAEDYISSGKLDKDIARNRGEK